MDIVIPKGTLNGHKIVIKKEAELQTREEARNIIVIIQEIFQLMVSIRYDV